MRNLAALVRSRLHRLFKSESTTREFDPRGVDLYDALQRVRAKEIDVGSLINIGAGRGDDFGGFQQVWPELQALMIDMDARFEPTWKQYARRYPSIKYIVCGAGSEDKDGFFEKSNDVGGVLLKGAKDKDNLRATSIRKIDSLVREFQMPEPYFLKFDTHGVELDVLAGATETLKRTSLIMMEVYNFKLNFVDGKNFTFDEMSLHLKSLGFRCVDLCHPLFRPGDMALWQLHLIFIRDDHPIWKHNGYAARPA